MLVPGTSANWDSDVRLTNWVLLVSLLFLVGGFAAINKFGTRALLVHTWISHQTLCISNIAPDATQFGEHTITQKHLYTGLFVIGIPMFWIAGPFSTFFWLIGASGVLILGHASLLEPGVESDYANIQDQV
jgi:hypothetical protein